MESGAGSQTQPGPCRRKVKTSGFLQSENFRFRTRDSGVHVKVLVMDLGFFLTSQAIRRQLAAMPCELYLIRLIHSCTRKPFPGERLWTASQLCHPTAVRFLRARNREKCDIYLH